VKLVIYNRLAHRSHRTTQHIGLRDGQTTSTLYRYIDLPGKYSELEILVLDFVKFSPVLRVFVIYRPPHYDVKAVSYVRLLTECLNSYQSNKKNVHLIVGDLNLPYVNWNVFTGPSDDINSIILNFVIDNGYNQLVNFETRSSNLLDVLLTDTDTLITSLTASPPISNSE